MRYFVRLEFSGHVEREYEASDAQAAIDRAVEDANGSDIDEFHAAYVVAVEDDA